MTTLTRNASPAEHAVRRPLKRRGQSDLKIALFFIAPAMIGFLVFYLVPTLRGIYLSFTEYSILGDPTWIGTANYEAIGKDPLFWNALAVNTHPGDPAPPLPDGQRNRRTAVVLAAGLSDRHCELLHRCPGHAQGRLLRERGMGHP